MKSRLTGSRLMNLLIIAVIMTLPLMYSGLFTWAYQKPMENLGEIKAIVVNLDKPATANLADGKKMNLNLGKDLSDELFKEDAPGFDWVPATSAEDAKAGLADGRYQAALWIPADLSSNLAELSELKADSRPATLKLETNDATNYLTGTMAHSVALSLQKLASEKGASRFVDNLLLSLGTIHDGMVQASDGAGQLADGTAKLADGSGKIAEGTNKLTASIGQFASGSIELSEAVQRYTDGVAKLNSGANEVNSHMQEFGSGMGSLKSGLATLFNRLSATDENSFQGGLNKLLAATAAGSDPSQPTLYDGASQLANAGNTMHDGAGKLAAGATQLKNGVEQLNGAANKAAWGMPQLAAGAQQLRAQYQPGANGQQTIRDGVNQIAGQLSPEGQFGQGVTQMTEMAQMPTRRWQILFTAPRLPRLLAKTLLTRPWPMALASWPPVVRSLPMGLAN